MKKITLNIAFLISIITASSISSANILVDEKTFGIFMFCHNVFKNKENQRNVYKKDIENLRMASKTQELFFKKNYAYEDIEKLKINGAAHFLYLMDTQKQDRKAISNCRKIINQIL